MGIISHIPIQVMSAVVYPQQIEFSRFLFEVKSKHFHQYTPLARQDKVKNISQLTTPIGALLCKFRQTCFWVLSTQGCRYNKKAGVLKDSGFTRGTMGLFESDAMHSTMIKESRYIYFAVPPHAPFEHAFTFGMIVIRMPLTH